MPAVRVPANTPEYISRVLDAGAMGIIAPNVRSAEEARAVVRAAKLPPQGERSNTGLFPQLQYRSFPAAETCQGDQRRHHGDRAVRVRRSRWSAPTRSSRSKASMSCWSA